MTAWSVQQQRQSQLTHDKERRCARPECALLLLSLLRLLLLLLLASRELLQLLAVPMSHCASTPLPLLTMS